jgi:hypothetical protein
MGGETLAPASPIDQLNNAEQTSQDTTQASSDEQTKDRSSQGFDTSSSTAPPVILPDSTGVANPDADSGGMPPPSESGQALGSSTEASTSDYGAEPGQEPAQAVAPTAQTPADQAVVEGDKPPLTAPEAMPQAGPTPSPSDSNVQQSQATAQSPPLNPGTQPTQPEPVSHPGPTPSFPVVSPGNFSSNSTSQIKGNESDFGSAVNSLDDADRFLKRMDWGQMAFNVPVSMPCNSSATIDLLISPTMSTNQLVAVVNEEIQSEGQKSNKVESATLKIFGRMQAVLVSSGSGFNIKLLTPEVQMLSRTEPTEWKWQIEPKKSGPQDLYLTVNAAYRLNGEDGYQMVRTFDRVIQVQVIPAPPFVRYWPEEGLTSLLAGVGGVIFVRRHAVKKRQRNAAVLNGVTKRADVFLSYSRRDEDKILLFVEKLQKAGIKVWIDQGAIDGAAMWAKEITEAIRTAKVFVLAASPASFASDHVVREISLALEERKPILPVYLEAVEMPSSIRYSLAGIQHIELYRGNRDEKIAQVVHSLEKLGIEIHKS